MPQHVEDALVANAGGDDRAAAERSAKSRTGSSSGTGVLFS
jgi:hypothetical protein